MTRRDRLLAFLTLFVLGMGVSGRAEALDISIREGLIPHKALYEIKMVSKRSGAQVVNISGQMFFEWKPVCDAWTTDHRFSLFYEYADAPPMQITSDFSTYEKYDGESFDFTSRRKRNGKLYQELRGRATRKQDGKGMALYTLPKDLRFDLPENTRFPMAHTLELLSLAKAGKKFFRATVFDGSDEDGPVEINAFIGKPVNALARINPTPDMDTSLINTPAWKIRMAFFPLKNTAEDSDYEMDVVFHENGIISDMLVDYKNFSITQKLVAIEEIEAEKCDTVEPPKKDDL